MQQKFDIGRPSWIRKGSSGFLRKMHLYTGLGIGIGLCSFASTQNTPTAVELASNAVKSQQFEKAYRVCERALATDPRSYTLWTIEGIALSGLSQPEKAEVAYKKALELAPYYLPALEGAAELDYRRGDAHAIPLLKKLLNVGADNPTTHGMLAVLEYKQQDCAAAIKDFEGSTILLSRNATMLNEYGFCLAELKLYPEAVSVLRQALALGPGTQPARVNLALAQWMDKDGAAALETLQPLLAAPEPGQEALNLAADISEAQDDIRKAVQLLRRAIVGEPGNVENYLRFAQICSKYGSYAAGIAVLDSGLAQVPKSAQLYVARGILYSQKFDYDKAASDFERANQLDPDLAVTASAEGLMRSQQHRSADALQTFQDAAKRRPNDAFTQYLLAESLAEKGYPAGSAGAQQEIAAAQRAILLNPDLADAHNLLASRYLQSGQIDLAIKESEQVLRTRPDDEQALYHLILALRKTDRKSEVAALVQRLTGVRQAAQAQAQQKVRYKISVEPSIPQTDTQLPVAGTP